MGHGWLVWSISIWSLQRRRPVPGRMKHAQDFNRVVADSIDDDVGKPGDDQFARPVHLAGATRVREISQAEYGSSDAAPHVGSRARIIGCDEGNVEPE